jgi:NAD(P)-dependent dehydrogenase (short-subunit alcohol dehydrogenase family)
LDGAVALVTGANSGVGEHFVRALLEAGAEKVYAAARRTESVAGMASVYPDRVAPVVLDITDGGSVEGAAARCADAVLLINNAGVGLAQRFIAAEDLGAIRAEMEVNYFGTLRMCRAFAPVLGRNGGGAVVNMLSALALVNLPANGSYSASKAAALSMTQGVRAELAGQGTLVVGVMPGTVDAGMGRDFPGPKVAPETVVGESLRAVEEGIEDVYPGEQAARMGAMSAAGLKEIEKQLSATVRGASSWAAVSGAPSGRP